MKFVLITFLFLFLKTILVSGEVNPCIKSTEGKDFWFGFMESRHHQPGHKNEITLTSVYECNYKIFIGKSTTPYTTGILAANSPMQITIDWTLVEAIGSESIQEKAIHLVSDMPLNVYALNWSPNSADVALIFPAESLGNEYYAMCYTPHLSKVDPNNGNAEGKNSELLIVASEDNTVVSITPTVVTDHLKPANSTYTITINKGELYQLQSGNVEAFNQGDLTGTYIKSNKPVALFSGSYSTTVPGDPGECCFDHLYEQIPTLQTWGRKFIAVPLKSREKDTYRVLASEDNTTIRIGNQTPIVLNKGQKYEFMLMHTEPSLVESDKPVLLAQYSNSQSVDKQFTNGDGDPFMVIVSPVNQTRERVAFVAYKSENIKDKYFINIVVKDDAIGKIILDGVPVSFQSLIGTGFSYAQVKISEGPHIIESTEQGKGFIAYVYGFGGVESYGYGVGFNLDIILDLGSNVNASGEKLLVRCDGSGPLTLNAGNGFDSYNWNTGETTPAIQVTNPGWYKVKVSTKLGCELVDSVELQVSKPIVDLGTDRIMCNPETTVLDAGSQFTSLLWSTTQTDPRITVSKSGNYFVEALNKFGCKAKDTIMVTFFDKPKIDFSRLDTLICGKKSDILDVKADKGSFTIQRLSDGFTSDGLEAAVPDFGTYDLRIKATDAFSCYSDSVISVGFRKTPVVNFSVDSTKCYGYNLDVKYLGDANIRTSDFVWVFGGDTIIRGVGLDAYFVPLGIDRTSRDLKLIVTDQGCQNDKTLHDIKVIPNLQMWVTDSLGCEPFTTQFMANNIETATYDWDFGDGNRLSGSTAAPDHTYQNDGFYPVKLKVTTKNGCTNEVLIEDMVYVAPRPKAEFNMDNHIVYNDMPTVNFLNSSIGAKFYTWDFGDGSTSDQKDVSHYFAVSGYQTVLLEVFNEFQCSDTVSHQLLVAFDRIFPPNAFSPNAPNEIDREFKLGTNGIATEGYHFTIISRWNDIVFEAREEIKGWNGQMQNGSPAPAGNYVWILDFNDFLGRRHRQTGTVTLVY